MPWAQGERAEREQRDEWLPWDLESSPTLEPSLPSILSGIPTQTSCESTILKENLSSIYWYITSIIHFNKQERKKKKERISKKVKMDNSNVLCPRAKKDLMCLFTACLATMKTQWWLTVWSVANSAFPICTSSLKPLMWSSAVTKPKCALQALGVHKISIVPTDVTFHILPLSSLLLTLQPAQETSYTIHCLIVKEQMNFTQGNCSLLGPTILAIVKTIKPILLTCLIYVQHALHRMGSFDKKVSKSQGRVM